MNVCFGIIAPLSFQQNKAGSVECDVEAGVRVCRAAGYLDHALTLAAAHHLHTHHLAILIQDKQDHIAALRYQHNNNSIPYLVLSVVLCIEKNIYLDRDSNNNLIPPPGT